MADCDQVATDSEHKNKRPMTPLSALTAPPSDGSRRAGRAPFARRMLGLGAVLYTGWTALAWFAHLAGTATLDTGTGWLLAIGALGTAAMLGGLATLSGTPQATLAKVCGAAGGAGLLWAGLYTALGAAGGWLGAGMSLSAAVLVLPTGSRRRFRRFLGAAILVFLLARLFAAGYPGRPVAAPELMLALTQTGLLAAMLGALWLGAQWFDAVIARLLRRNSELRHALEQTARKAELDELTDSYNRGCILAMLDREKARADRTGESFCVCLLDIDHFKAMNDQFGHLTGDRVLAGFARRVRGELRSMDTLNRHGRTSSLGRVGGEEFLVALPQTTLRGALRCAERLRRAVVRRPFNGLHQVTVSIGIAEYRPGETIADLLERADEALYGAKRGGRNRVHGAGARGAGSRVVMPEIPAAS